MYGSLQLDQQTINLTMPRCNVNKRSGSVDIIAPAGGAQTTQQADKQCVTCSNEAKPGSRSCKSCSD